MEALQFTKVGDEYVSEDITDIKAFNIHLAFPTAFTSLVKFEVGSNGNYQTVAIRQVAKNYEETVVNLAEGDTCRIITTVNPEISEIYKIQNND